MSKDPDFVIGFNTEKMQPKELTIDDPNLVDTPYKSASWRFFENAEKGALSGIWEAEPHLERCSCDYDELCHILQGRVRLTDDSGVSREFGAGESFVVAAGFKGTWENLTFVKKVFFIL
ncbi:cupin [Marinomonas piezotolerans]|uniref:Cupin n=1 Tax=Marinomonas piezotolerans TaxID=2213058 RepID=A0A370U9W2_9GAMM|nr:cupin domain-containing protein [Marinomonas piezotolerans]RDL44554.1 cupin [Marinomonas piezotolerans]